MLEKNKIYLMDCIQGLKSLTGVDLIISDPPYNVGGKSKQIVSEEKKFASIKETWDNIENFEEWNKKWIQASFDSLRDGGSILVWGTRHNIYLCGYQLEQAGFNLRGEYIWYKNNAMPCLTGRSPSLSTEICIWATKENKWTYNLDYAKSINNNQNFRNLFTTPMTPPSEKKEGKHPSQKRLSGLTDHLVNLHSNKDDLIVAPFCGSGTECVAAKAFNRNYVGFEIEQNYIDLANRRLDSLISIDMGSKETAGPLDLRDISEQSIELAANIPIPI